MKQKALIILCLYFLINGIFILLNNYTLFMICSFICSFNLIHKWNKRVAYLGENVFFFKPTRIQLTHGAKKSNIKIDSYARVYRKLTSCKNGRIEKGKYSHIGPNTKILCVNSIKIGEYTTIAPNVTIVDNNNHPLPPYDRKLMCQVPQGDYKKSPIVSGNKPIVIGNVVWIGENEIVAANPVVTKNVLVNSIVAGVPAKVIKEDICETTKSVFNK